MADSDASLADKDAKNERLEKEMDDIINQRVLNEYENRKKSKSSRFNALKVKTKATTPDSKLKGSFSIFKGSKTWKNSKKDSSSPITIPITSPITQTSQVDFTAEEGEKENEENEDKEDGENEDGEEETADKLTTVMRESLQAMGVEEIEEDDDWKQMVIKTRLKLKEIKDMIMGGQEGLTDDERTKKTKFVLSEEKMLDVHFRLDFSHTTPVPSEFSDMDDSDFEEIKPDVEGLETPDEDIEESEKKKKKRLKKRDKAIKKCEKLNLQREERLKEKRRIRAIEKAEIAAREAAEAIEGGSQAGSKKYNINDEEGGSRADSKSTSKYDINDENLDKLKLSGEEEEEEEEDLTPWYEQLQEDTGIRILINTEGLEEKWEAQKVVLQEYKEIFFGPDLTEEEIAELEKIEQDDKHFTINLKFIIRKKTRAEKEEERLKAEEEARQKAIENGEIVEGEEEEDAGGQHSSDEGNVLDEMDERKEEKREDFEAKKETDETESPTNIDYEKVQL